VSVRVVKHEPTVQVTLDASVWVRIGEVAMSQANESKNWTVVNQLGDAFTEAKDVLKAHYASGGKGSA